MQSAVRGGGSDHEVQQGDGGPVGGGLIELADVVAALLERGPAVGGPRGGFGEAVQLGGQLRAGEGVLGLEEIASAGLMAVCLGPDPEGVGVQHAVCFRDLLLLGRQAVVWHADGLHLVNISKGNVVKNKILANSGEGNYFFGDHNSTDIPPPVQRRRLRPRSLHSRRLK